MIPDMAQFDCIVVNTSAGKDSQTALRVVAEAARGSGSAMVAVHADLGRVEWPGTKELAQRQCDHYGIPLIVVKHRDKHGRERSLLDYIRERGKWPSSTTRFCTSDFKRTPCGRVFTKLTGDIRAIKHDSNRRVKFLNVFGFRAEESPARSKRPVFSVNAKLTNSKRQVWDYLPIHEWTERQVWDDIHKSGVPYHPAYDLGMPRLSCSFCIFAPKSALMIAGKARPDLLEEYVQLEREIGHTFKNKMSIAEVKSAIESGEQVGEMDGNWNM